MANKSKAEDSNLHPSGFTTEVPSIMIIMLCAQCTLGGAEKRYGRVFENLAEKSGGERNRLLINRSLYELLTSAGILLRAEQNIIILDPPLNYHPSNFVRGWLSWFVNFIWFSWQCCKAIQQHKPEVIHPLLTGVYYCIPTLLLIRKKRFVMSAYSYRAISIRDVRIFGYGLGSIIRFLVYKKCHIIDALSQSIRDELIERGIPADKICVAPNSFTDLSDCRPFSQKEPWVVFAGRFISFKNPVLLIMAIPAIMQKYPDTTFKILGSGPLQSEMERLVSVLNIDDNVQIKFEPRPTEIFARSKIFVSLQNEENFPSQSLLEAMACENAIVATDVGETRRLVDRSNGILVTPSEISIAEAIINLLGNENIEKLGKASRKKVTSEHTLERFLDYISNVYSGYC